MPTARVIIPATDLATLLDLPEGVQLMAGRTEPAGDIALLISGPDIPEGDARLVYEMDEMAVPALVAIEPVQQDG